MSMHSTSFLMAQRGRMFKREPQAVVREMPRATGLRALAVGDVIRDRTAPDQIFRVLRVTACAAHVGHVTVWDDDRRCEREASLPLLALRYEHADGAAVEPLVWVGGAS